MAARGVRAVSSSLAPGMILRDTYEVVRLIAEGGMGAVYEAKHLRLGDHRVAIKVLLPRSGLRVSEMASRFRREAEICAKLAHPNIIAVTDWDTMEDGTSFFVMEYLDGEDLAVRMKRGALAHAEVHNILVQIGAALDAAHGQGVVHRDLKPRNIFLARTGGPDHVKVLDFGISKLIGDETLATTTTDKVLGSPRYMSPEQARGHSKEIGPLSDQFSLGSIAYELYAGRAAFAAASVESTMFNIVHEDPESLLTAAPDAPPTVIAAITRALAKEPEARFPSTRELVTAMYPDHNSAWFAADAATPPEGPAPPHPADAETVSVGTRKKGSDDRRFPLVWLAVPLLGMVLGVGAIAVWKHETPEPAAAVVVDVPADDVEPVPVEPPVEKEKEKHKKEKKKATPVRDPDRSKERIAVPIPSEVLAKLERAREYLAAGDPGGALRMAQQSVGLRDTAAARKLIVQAYCARRDLEMAHASLNKVAKVDLPEVRKYCEQQGLTLRR